LKTDANADVGACLAATDYLYKSHYEKAVELNPRDFDVKDKLKQVTP
jgi:hypothetical protein